MLSFPSQKDKNFFPTDRVYLKKQPRVTENQHVFNSGLIPEFCIPCVKISQNEANWKNVVFLILIWIPGGTHAVKVWLNKSITQKSNLIENNIEKSTYEKLLGVYVDYNLKFNEHLESILKKAVRKVDALLRILP